MKSLHAVRLFCACGLALLAVSFLTACQTKIEQQNAFKSLVDRQDRTDKDVDAIRRQLSVIDRDLQQVSLDVSETLKKGGGGNPQVVSALDQRMSKLEGMLKTTGETLTAITLRLDKLDKGGSKAAVNVAAAPMPADQQTPKPTAAKDSPAKNPAGTKTALVVNKKTGTRQTAAASSARKTEQTEVRGIYHLMSQGETLGQIARTYQVSEASLRVANGLPPGRNLPAGQQVYVPASR